MGTQLRWPGGLARISSILLCLALAIPTNALYFYFSGHTPKCFYEELPKDTLVVGSYPRVRLQLSSPLLLNTACRSLQGRDL